MPVVPIDPPAGPDFCLAGRVVTMDDHDRVLPDRRVYVSKGAILDVRTAADPPPQGFNGPVVETGGTIYPGLIELHNHLSYNALPLWEVPEKYGNRARWQGSDDYHKLVSAPMNVIGKLHDYVAALVRYVECKLLLGGVTTSQGVSLFSFSGITKYYAGIVRNVERTDDPQLPAARARVPDVDADDAEKFLARLQSPTHWLLHLAEGKDPRAREHFTALQLPDKRWAITPTLTGIHCAALEREDFDVLAAHGGSMVWSPLSNLLLYGDTAKVAEAKAAGVLMGIGSDWSPSGSRNLLAELKIARLVARRDGALTDSELVAMATRNPARMLGWQEALGSIQAGKRADLLVIDTDAADPYAGLLEAAETDIGLVVINGVARYGTPALMAAASTTAPAHLESIAVGGSPRQLDLRQSSEFPDVAALTLAAATAKLADGLNRLPDLARQLEQQPLTALMALDADPRFLLVLDHDEPPGIAIRPHLRDAAGQPTAEAPARALAAAKPLSQVVQPTELDALTVADDAGYFDRLRAQRNLPDDVKGALS